MRRAVSRLPRSWVAAQAAHRAAFSCRDSRRRDLELPRFGGPLKQRAQRISNLWKRSPLAAQRRVDRRSRGGCATSTLPRPPRSTRRCAANGNRFQRSLLGCHPCRCMNHGSSRFHPRLTAGGSSSTSGWADGTRLGYPLHTAGTLPAPEMSSVLLLACCFAISHLTSVFLQ